MEIWKEHLIDLAKKTEMCSPFFDILKECQSKEDAIRLYKRNVTWAAKNNYPDIEFLRKEFSGMDNIGFFIDREFRGEIIKSLQVYVFHHCSGYFYIDMDIKLCNIPMLYMANDSNLSIFRAESADKGSISVPIYLFDKSVVTCTDTERVKFSIIKQ